MKSGGATGGGGVRPHTAESKSPRVTTRGEGESFRLEVFHHLHLREEDARAPHVHHEGEEVDSVQDSTGPCTTP